MTDHLDEELQLSDLDEQYRPLAEAAGVRGMLGLMETYGGTYLYVPKKEAVLRKLRNMKIRAEFDGYNYRHLAHKYHLTEISIRHIIKQEIPTKNGRGTCSSSDR